MEHVVVYFRHDMKAIMPYSEAVQRIRQLLAETGVGEYVGDDMAIDGGDAEAVLAGRSAVTLFDTVAPVLKELPFMREAKITLVFGALESGSPEKMFLLQSHPIA